jgi:hypothetical protein
MRGLDGKNPPHLWFGQEIEDIKALKQYTNVDLMGFYRNYLIEGNDSRGIDISLGQRKDTPFNVKLTSHRDVTMKHPITGETVPAFSRDLVFYEIYHKADIYHTAPIALLIGVHFKSKRDGGNDPESLQFRTAQLGVAAELIKKKVAKLGKWFPVIVAGDFNGDVNHDQNLIDFQKMTGLTNAFDHLPDSERPSIEDRVTHTYHPRGGPTHKAQMDAFLISSAVGKILRQVKVVRYINA